jgi:hypothetical protein
MNPLQKWLAGFGLIAPSGPETREATEFFFKFAVPQSEKHFANSAHNILIGFRFL